ncbi:RPA-related protein RADX isoform X1 [Anguilla anguilla]|uniref:RPA-related protein RADX isoform X1 n=1 Tax=Anguilla anguilla TaxID=7936 RepID=UPI0015AE8BE2|nr:RPA-related protein RADX isoform X1 [Anguilla anguilla]
MAVAVSSRPGCVLQRTFSWPNTSCSHSESAKTCREPLFLLSIDRYAKDLGFGIFFPEAIHASDNLYDATVSDGDCKLRVTIHPGLNPLVERNELRCGCQLRNVTFSHVIGLEGRNEGDECPTYRVMNLEVDVEAGFDAGLEAFCGIDIDALPWFGLEGDNRPSLLPLRAKRSSYLPMWNNQDYYGEMWKDTAPTEPIDKSSSDSGEETEDLQPTVTLREVRQAFLCRSRVIKGILIVRILHKSRLFYYGKAESNCECPYKAVFEVADRSGQASVVLWNTLCMDWYRIVHPGSTLRLAHYRVKESYNSRTGENAKDDIEISLNSRNPSADISLIPKKDVLPQWHLPHSPYNFCCGKEIVTCPVGSTCDVIGLVVFVGRPERTRNKDRHGVELWEYRWLQLEDGTTEQPVMVKLFSTSQPEIHSNIHPMAIMVCTNVQLMRVGPDRTTSFQYLTNTSLTQVYCTGSGHHSTMPYRRLRPVRQFIQWLQTVDENRALSKAVIGGFFTYPPLPVSLEMYMRDRNGEPGLVTGVELRREAEKLQYRESRTLAIQATVSAVSHVRTGEEEGCSALTDWTAWSPSASSTCSRAPVARPSPPSSITLSPRSPRLRVRHGPLGSGRSAKRRLFHTVEPPRKRLPLPLHSTQLTDPEEDADRDFSLWDASMEFLDKAVEDESDDDDDEEEDSGSAASFFTAPSSPCSPRRTALGLARAASETVPRQFCPQRREVQAAAVGLQPASLQDTLPKGKLGTFAPADCYDGHYTLSLRELTDGGMVDALFLPGSPGNLHWRPYPHPHVNSWEAILSHGGFSPSAPPPAPSDLIAMATQLTGKRLVCVLEVCQLGSGRVEIVLTRAFPLKD